MVVRQDVRVRNVLPHARSRRRVGEEVRSRAGTGQLGPVAHELADVALGHALVGATLLVGVVDVLAQLAVEADAELVAHVLLRLLLPPLRHNCVSASWKSTKLSAYVPRVPRARKLWAVPA